MANKPNKSKDPTEVALSAIQDALDMREPRGGMGTARESARTPGDDDLFMDYHFNKIWIYRLLLILHRILPKTFAPGITFFIQK